MKYAFVTLSIFAVWVATICIVIFLEYNSIFLPLLALFMSVILFVIGFGSKK